MRLGVFAALALAAAWPANGQDVPGAAAGEIEVETRLDRTAMWVGDRVTYVVVVRCGRGTNVLATDLGKDKLMLDGLEVVSSEMEESTGAEGTLYRVSHTLTTTVVDQSLLRVAPFTLRYYVRRPGQRVGDAAPAGEVTVPGAVIARRSVLPDEAGAQGLRDARDPASRPLTYRLARPVGLGLILVSLVPALVWAGGGLRRWWRRPSRRRGRAVRRGERSSIDALRALDVATHDGRRAAYDGIESLLRRHATDTWGLDSAGLTSAELAQEIARAQPGLPADRIRALLAECERARYAPVRLWPSRDDCGAALDEAARLVGQR
jgi:hypothetical protein